ncbi:hypothetical protein HT031_004076 [Scenedesmus sp. PABB004]|nr:hypothetical protein HT031_004076 [Scenedesmus sp. PABB004]
MAEAAPPLGAVDAHYLGSLYTVAALDGQTKHHLEETIRAVACDAKTFCVMCVGHNKGWEEAASAFARQAVRLGTASAALFEAGGGGWEDVTAPDADWRLVQRRAAPTARRPAPGRPGAAMASADMGAKQLQADKLMQKAGRFWQASLLEFRLKPDWEAAAPLFEQAGTLYKQVGQLEKARAAFEKAAQSQEKIGSVWHAAKHLETCGALSASLGQHEAMADFYRQAGQFFAQAGRIGAAADALARGAKALEAAAPGDAAALYGEALELYEGDAKAGQAGDVFRQAIALAARRCAWQDAVGLLMRFGEACDTAGARGSQAKAYLGAIVVWLHAGEPRQAWQVFQDVLGVEAFSKSEEAFAADALFLAYAAGDAERVRGVVQCFKALDNQVARLAVRLPAGDLAAHARAVSAVMGGRDPDKSAEQEEEEELLPAAAAAQQQRLARPHSAPARGELLKVRWPEPRSAPATRTACLPSADAEARRAAPAARALRAPQRRAGPVDAPPVWTLDQIAGLAFGVRRAGARPCGVRRQRPCGAAGAWPAALSAAPRATRPAAQGLMAAFYFGAQYVDVFVARQQRRELGLCEACGGVYEPASCSQAQCPMRHSGGGQQQQGQQQQGPE